MNTTEPKTTLLSKPIAPTQPNTPLERREDAQAATSPRALPQPSAAKDAQELRVEQVGDALAKAYAAASTLKLTEREEKILSREFSDDDVDILPSGECYISHIHISRRLSEAVGRGQWSLVTRRHWYDQVDKVIYAECVLIIRGAFVGEAVGAQDYIPQNKRMDFSDALEGAQSEALRRIAAKRLSVGDQVWMKSYCRAWIAKHAVQVWARRWNGERELVWRRRDALQKDDEPFTDALQQPSAAPRTTTPASSPAISPEDDGRDHVTAPEPNEQTTHQRGCISEKQAKRLWAIASKQGGLSSRDVRRLLSHRLPYLVGEDGKIHLRNLKREDYETTCDWLAQGAPFTAQQNEFVQERGGEDDNDGKDKVDFQ